MKFLTTLVLLLGFLSCAHHGKKGHDCYEMAKKEKCKDGSCDLKNKKEKCKDESCKLKKE